MECRHDDILFARFFNAETTEGQQLEGFADNIDFSAFADFEWWEYLEPALVDGYLYNEYGKRYVLSTWTHFMYWDKAAKKYKIDPDFFEVFQNSLASQLLSVDTYYKLSQLDLTKIKEIRERDARDDVKEDDPYNDAHTAEYAGYTNTNTYINAKRKNTRKDDIAQHVVDVDDSKSAFNDTNYVPTDKSKTTASAYLDTITSEDDAHTDTVNMLNAQHTDTFRDNISKHKTTNKYAKDKWTITKDLDPETLLAIRKEMAALNIYQLFGDAIAAAMCRKDWGCE